MTSPSPHDDLSVVALVASAGGLDAVSRVLADVPRTLHAAVVVLIHLPPDKESSLVALLGRQSALPVAAVTDGAELTAGHVVVAPPGHHVLIAPGPTTRLVVSGASPPSRPSADLLLTTLAVSVGRRAVAVVLTGNGHDGATGATAVHAFGGTVLATDEATSEVFSMPKATIDRDEVIDQVVGLGDLGEALGFVVGSSAEAA